MCSRLIGVAAVVSLSPPCALVAETSGIDIERESVFVTNDAVSLASW